MDGVITLIRQTYRKDLLGQDIAEETKREVFCEYQSATRAEWTSAGQNGFSVDGVAVMNRANYQKERVAEVDGERKAIYRVFYPQNSDLVELYLSDEVGR